MATKSDQGGLGPVSLPAGSYDTEKLADSLAAAAKAKPEDQEGLVSKAIEDARAGGGTEVRDPSLMPGHAMVDVTTPHGTERRQVFVPPAGDRKPDPEPLTAEQLEKKNVAGIKSQVAEAKREGEVAPEPEAEPLAGPGPAVAAEAAAAATGDDKK